MRSVLTVYRWELRKLRAQKRTYLGLGAAAAVPIIFVVALVTGGGRPNDVAFGRYVHDTGLAVPLVLLLFGSIWLFPLITALVAGDIVASEDRNATLKMILTRSVERHQVFAGKALATVTYAVLAIAIAGVVALAAGILASGFNPVTTLSGTVVSAPKGLELVGRQPARLSASHPRHRLHRPAALHGISQQRSGDRRHPDVLSPGSAGRNPARAERTPSVSAQHPVQRLAGVASHAG